jgi:hypothetical protein
MCILYTEKSNIVYFQGTDADLTLVDSNRFIELTVEKDCELKAFIDEDKNLKFVRGAAFYEFTRTEEDIKFDKELILMDVVRIFKLA